MKFDNLNYRKFQELALDPTLSLSEKIGFPDSYRAGKSEAIWADWTQKLPALQQPGATILDIGCGCGELAHHLIAQTASRGQSLLLVDSAEVLSQLPEAQHLVPFKGSFPENTFTDISIYKNNIDCIIIYSVIQYIFCEGSIYSFIDKALSLLAPGGQLLIGDIPNISKRKRLLASDAGVAFHRAHTHDDSLPEPFQLALPAEAIDDGVLFGILQRYRNAGFEAYVLPQAAGLPMANRREDLLICKH